MRVENMKALLVINGEQREIVLTRGETLRDILKKNNLNEETGLAKINGKLTHPLSELQEGDKVEFINIIYGG